MPNVRKREISIYSVPFNCSIEWSRGKYCWKELLISIRFIVLNETFPSNTFRFADMEYQPNSITNTCCVCAQNVSNVQLQLIKLISICIHFIESKKHTHTTNYTPIHSIIFMHIFCRCLYKRYVTAVYRATLPGKNGFRFTWIFKLVPNKIQRKEERICYVWKFAHLSV